MKRRRRHDRLKRIRTERHELALFFERGTFPASAQCCAMCPCGARAFSRDPLDLLEDFYEAHAYCEVDGSDYA
ncbi:MAG: hypothetical protein K0S37_2399 [Microbacterium sp.]|jgi:hypothetical protein|nr:hypothetical protein [Microbacterium sp.]